jgi:hypothetical protein
MIPFISRLEKSHNVLFAGCGGGFDVYAGVPLAQYLWARGKSVFFANFSFANLWMCGGERIQPQNQELGIDCTAILGAS